MLVPAFVHRVYLEMYFDPDVVPAGAVEYVEELGNCEDILLSVVVTKFLHDMNMAKSGALLLRILLPMKMAGMFNAHFFPVKTECYIIYIYIFILIGHTP